MFKFPNNNNKYSIVSLVEESNPKYIRMSNLAIVGSYSVNGVSQIHTETITSKIFKDFKDMYPDNFLNITNGVTQRRWIVCAFPELEKLITKFMGSQEWISDMSLLKNLENEFQNSTVKQKKIIEGFADAKFAAKIRLAEYVKKKLNIIIDPSHFFDIQSSEIDEHRRQLMNILYCVLRYLTLKDSNNKDGFTKRVTLFSGKSFPDYYLAKNIIKLINMVCNHINSDISTNQYYKVIFIPNYKVSIAQILIPAADLSHHIPTPGTEASGTSVMKYAMTGSLIIGSKEGANMEIAKEISEDNIFLFGNDRNQLINIKQNKVDDKLKKVIETLIRGDFGDINFMKNYLIQILNGDDNFLVGFDFNAYSSIQAMIEIIYQNKEEWKKKCILSICRMGYFSSDRSIRNYVDNIWKLDKVDIKKI